ncbi:riboflavin biosynthesis protein RibD [Legionella geestiana]|uniref:Riboflavin biosynthesis protein RibD n=1 Tax=Legionella geestiana TaxID=45065 RepID=A0A0W0TQT1_9GAMM|nr:bifunctional diaminohydroxyphosphoribosylaminopyrimidine deaminase/5-amino-6-(5-phosphoribosylamino)uracil reductase RibD [Legionella geestiana]KTC97916.1 riboflavin biosynthesis protein RibD [Legionella geestiana]QBS11773.1 bifunctional diaminohydroxyphosphoribosylaminopyrimidine deaminase/5-amino-6-(5-phosphoribosylamino)uracil reductase RibD [Legionella geestiana]STX53535.1 riboflavin biosynthesis protein [Legionella geestiana]
MHEQYLLAALEQAWLGRGRCAPNPAVGAVAVANGHILAKAFHPGAGQAHAEVLLLAQFPSGTPEVTVYVTLEPCNHWGKTPPCVDALIRHGVSRVVYGYRDPHPLVAHHNTPELLSAAGIEVIFCPLPEIDEFYTSYCHWVQSGLPRVTVKTAQTFDGRIAGHGGKAIHITNDSTDRFTHTQRLYADVILSTARTIATDNPALNARLDGRIHGRPVAILDSQGTMSVNARLLETASHVYLFHRKDACVPAHPRISAYPVPGEGEFLDLRAVFAKLGELGFQDVWVEAGATLFASLHREALVARTYLILVPRVLGESAVAAFTDADIFARPHTVSWQESGNNMIACFDWQEG